MKHDERKRALGPSKLSDGNANYINSKEIQDGSATIFIHLEVSHKLMFIFGLIFGVFVLQHQLLIKTTQV